MTKAKLEQLNDLREEIVELDEKIIKLSSQIGGIVCDKVQASSKEFPYTQRSVKIEGYDHEGDSIRDRRIAKQKNLLLQRKQQAAELEQEITAYINGISDSRTRRIFECRYIEGKTWEEIGRKLHCDRTTVEKKVANYLKKHL